MKMSPLLLLIFCALFLPPPGRAQLVKLERPKNHGGFFSFVFAPDGTTVAGGTGKVTSTSGTKTEVAGGEVLLWDVKTGRIRRTLGTHDATVQWVMFSANGGLLASASEENGLVKIWDGKTGALRHTLKLGSPLGDGPAGVTSLCALSPDGKLLATVAVTMKKVGKIETRDSDRLTVWDTATGKARWELPNSDVEALTFSDDGTALVAFAEKTEWTQSGDRATGKSSNQRLVGWEAASGKERFSNEKVKTSPWILTSLPRMGVVMFAGGKLVLIDSRTGQMTKETKLSDRDSFYSVSFSPDQKRFVAPEFMGEAVHWFEVENGQRVATQEFKPERIWTPAFSPDLKRIVCKQPHEPVIFDLQPMPENR